MAEFPEKTGYYFIDRVEFDDKSKAKFLKAKNAPMLEKLRQVLDALESFDENSLEQAFTRVMEELDGAHRYYEYKERCIFCDIVKQEISENVRIVVQNDFFISIEPFAPRFPFETWILPKEHISSFEDTPGDKIASLAQILEESLKRLSKALNSPPYNYLIHTKPIDPGGSKEYHWHIEIMPRLTRVAGFEWGTGFFINPTTPEDAATYLKEIEV